MQQIQDPRLQVTGGEMQLLGNQAFLALGQDFQGDYFSPTATQTYIDEIQSFQISYNGLVSGSLAISNYQAQNDQVNFRRRDYDLGNIIQSGLQPALEVYGGVFTPGAPTDPNGGEGYRTPIVVSGVGATQVSQYQQFFNQYSAPEVGLYDANTQSMYTVFFGGISLYDYNFSTGQLTADSELPFVDDVTTLQQSAGGVTQEFEMPSQLPGLYGSEASFFATPGLPEYANGVIQLNGLSQPTTLGYMYGGILSTVPNTTDPATQTSATDALFRIVLVPLPTTYTVTSLADTDTGSGDSGTLRYVLNLANANHTGTASLPDHIQFATGAGTIAVGLLSDGAPLPALASDEVAIIDATTATGYTGTPIITLNGTLASAVPDANGLTISGGSSTIKGLDIVDFSGNGIQLDTNGGDTVLSSYIGITTAGVIAANGGDGIDIVGTANNIIGSSTPIGSVSGLGGNVISGNSANGVLIEAGADNNTVAGNYIGIDATGTVALGNQGDGIQLDDADNNTIGNVNPVSSVTYGSTSNITSNPVSVWQGIRNGNVAGSYMITGTSGANGLLFDGTISGLGTTYLVDFPGAATTSVYGPDNQGGLNIGLVGSYKNADASTALVKVNGFVFEGTTAELTQSNDYQTVDEPDAEFNYVHSTMQGLAVGNYDSAPDHGLGGLPLGPGQAFIYDVAENTFLTNIVYPESLSDTAYGIWYNGNGSYTICGGWSPNLINNLANQNQPIGQAFLVDYNAITGQFSNWASFSYPFGTNFVTHFEGISSVEKGVYTLSADSVQSGSTNPTQGSWVTVVRNPDGSFGTAQWVNLNYTGVDPTTNITSSNSVYGYEVVGQVIGTSTFPFQATVNVSLQLSNVISGNGGNGIQITGANDNQIAMNYIGTDVTGTVDLGNDDNGILITADAAGNLIGGEATGGNDPTGDVFVVPPQGNLISGNLNDGVLINDLATGNQLSGNFIGTDASGNAALGNAQDGVAIDNADDNELIGCTLQEDPFVFYNVISGNGGNGLRVTDSSDITIQANFFGLGADNITPVGNALDGVLINGSSANMQFGGVIPLGNVVAANDRNGVEIAGTASGGVYFNTFCGVPAFINTAVGNGLDGFLVTSTGGSNLIRTTIISGNDGNGIHISGNATGVQVTDAIIGMNSNGLLPLPNGGDGVLIDGNAHGNAIGGFQPSVAPQDTISDNGANGVAILGNASDNIIFNCFLGTDVFGALAAGNASAGILIGGNAQGTIIGGTDPSDQNLVSGNLGGGIRLIGTSQDTTVIGNLIGTDDTGLQPLGNEGNGITIDSSNNTIGGTTPGQGNVIAFNTQNGVDVNTGTGDGIRGNSIFGNTAPGILLVADGNLNQPAPVLTGATVPDAGSIQITGTLTAAADTTYSVDMFVSLSNTPPGQGQTFLGFVSVTTGETGIASIVFNAELPANTGTVLTATATSLGSNTSPFSLPFFIVDNTPMAETISLPSVPITTDGSSVTYTITYSSANFNSSTLTAGNVTLNRTGTANGTVGVDGGTGSTRTVTISNITGSGGLSISLAAGTATDLAGNEAPGVSSTYGFQVTISPTVFTVTNTGDSAAPGSGTLRAAILAADAMGGPTAIHFSIGTGVQTINLGTPLPVIDTNVIIDGTTQPGSEGAPAIVINGSGLAPGSIGLCLFEATLSIVEGLSLVNFGGGGQAILVEGNSIYVRNDLIGVTPNGTAGPNSIGILLAANNATGVQNDQIGAAGAGNTVENNEFGIFLQNYATNGNPLSGNLIQGNTIVNNSDDGVDLINNAAFNTVGGLTVGAGNVISGNGRYGVFVYGMGTSANLLEANLIGTNAAGTAANANLRDGVILAGTASNNIIGGSTFGAGNVISGNSVLGVLLSDSGTTGNSVLGNYIGTNAAGTAAVPNGLDGVYVTSSANGNIIGGTASGAGNVISGNASYGIALITVSSTQVEGNRIGTNAAGTAAIPNLSGMDVAQGATDNIIGGTATGAGNVISGNTDFGILITDSTTAFNAIEGNSIGTQIDSVSPLGNGSHGVFITSGAHNNATGGTSAADANTIAFNGGTGVLVGTDSTFSLTTAAGDGNAIEMNPIYENSDYDIHLGSNSSATINDGNGHTGINNNFQNTPILASAQSGSSVVIAGSLTQAATPNTTFRIEFYAISSNGTKTFLGFITVTSNGSGVASWDTTLTGVSVAAGVSITATATDNLGNTSAYSPSVTASMGVEP